MGTGLVLSRQYRNCRNILKILERSTKEVVRIRRKSIGNTVKAKRGRFLGVFHRDTIARQRSLFVAFGGQRKNYVD